LQAGHPVRQLADRDCRCQLIRLQKLFCLNVLTFSEKLPTTPNLELLAKQECNEIDGSTGAIITLRLVCEYVSYAGRPFVMISRCNGVRANNSCRELLVLEPVLRKLRSGTKVHDQVNVLTIHK